MDGRWRWGHVRRGAGSLLVSCTSSGDEPGIIITSSQASDRETVEQRAEDQARRATRPSRERQPADGNEQADEQTAARPAGREEKQIARASGEPGW
ncbi:predicted protein [Uncinocarpus reesii 1704]|uniref:Uncharacterized protein n=1 Tax=Uncinocarpus reesii (strain UAMH 1704) TaxID=336963 RepID=C4JJ30_UNCRE|nr:uncharacterized protein UREG_01637 [Uncinocarpus reesii 1704]EEP76788.1 predicted protein [Uncinocarpus reesii 1704]